MSRHVRIALILTASFSLSVYFVNCAGGLPDNLETAKAQSSGSSTNVTTFSATITPSQVIQGQSAQVSVSGGTPPYLYSITKGSVAASVNNLGLISGIATAGSVMIEITDANSQSAFATLIVGQPAPVTATSCTTPWGATLASGTSVPGFTTATVDCPATCTPAALTCLNGFLTGSATAANCAVNSCVYKESSAGLCPNSGNATSIVTTAPVPPTCSPSQYHIYYCQTVGRQGTEYHCVSPTEAP